MLFYILGMSDSLFYTFDGGIRKQFKSTTMNEQWPDLYVRYQSSLTPAIWLCADLECTTLRKDLQLTHIASLKEAVRIRYAL